MILFTQNPSHPKPWTCEHNTALLTTKSFTCNIVKTPFTKFKVSHDSKDIFDARQNCVHMKIGEPILFVYVTVD